MYVIDDDGAMHAVHPGSAKSVGLRSESPGRLPDARSHQSAKSGTDEHRRLFARIANLDGVAARDWTIAADDALRLNATSVRITLLESALGPNSEVSAFRRRVRFRHR
jgi:hypothetical protein